MLTIPEDLHARILLRRNSNLASSFKYSVNTTAVLELTKAKINTNTMKSIIVSWYAFIKNVLFTKFIVCQSVKD